MKKLLFIFLLTTMAFGQFAPHQKPSLGLQINRGHPLARGLVGCWLFNEGSGNKVFDLSGNGNHLDTITGTVNWSSGKYGSCLYFPSAGQHHIATSKNVPLSLQGDASVSVVSWVKRTKNAYDDIICAWGARSADDMFWLALVSTDEVRLAFYGDDLTTTTSPISANQWYQIVATYDAVSNLQTIYVDGQYVTSRSTGDAETFVASPFYVGGFSGYNTCFDGGYIDNILVYNRALSASEIALLYREPFCMFEQDNVALYYQEPPPAGGGQVIMIQMTCIPLIFILTLCFLMDKNKSMRI